MNGENLLFFFSFSYEKKVRRRRRIFFFSLFIPGSSVGASTTIATVAEGEIERERKKRALQQGMTRLEWLKHGTTVRGSLRGKRKNNNWKKLWFPIVLVFCVTNSPDRIISLDRPINESTLNLGCCWFTKTAIRVNWAGSGWSQFPSETSLEIKY